MPTGPLHRRDRAAASPAPPAAGDIVDLDGKVLGRHDGIIHFTVGQRQRPEDRRRRAALRGAARCRAAARRGRPARGADHAAHPLRDVNWIGEGALDAVLDDGRLEVFVKVRSTRPPQAAWLSRAAGGYEVELVDGEDGVSPGQACVFYDGAQGQARVLGGGFIRARRRRRRGAA